MQTAIEQKSQPSLLETLNLNRIILLVTVALILRAFFIYEPPLIPLKVGDPLPEFQLKLFNGKNFENKDIAGTPYVFFFYADWCPCANLSAPYLKQAYQEYSHKGIRFLAVGFQDKKEHLESFVSRHQIPFSSGADINNELSRSFGVVTPPTTLFVNSQGTLSSIFIGKIKKYGELTGHLEKLEI